MTDRASDAETPQPGEGKAGETGEGTPRELDPGLFAKLPRSRPGARSPRRRSSEGRPSGSPKSAPRSAPKSASRERATTPPPRAAAPPPPRREPAAREEEPEGASGGIEELAWAGIAVTAEAATLGVRLLSRAIDAARRATDRR